ncbi:MAG: DUF4167 domain-containing protein [Salibaculum sp.]|jgi:hypothetical protein|uniref:DUF4167 domain-containing protein n=1 Tax=Salibaculum sp. TaxID=2855480 RepID=UPI00286FC0F6|nr:DUF4167 domain-containing protein [Salibaculum sp.]MDR9428032.1 DUF4167 domain-containing protein [Salibaculum sp.]MDR9482934.1 DUF4167 domain-containing protein [Salibaculum sp.]
MKPSRSRSRKNRNNRPSGGNVINRVFDSSGPEGKVRGTPQQIIDKYQQLHRDAVLSGDRVNAENFAQHAEHYLRLLAEAQREVDSKREEQERQNRERQAERDRERADRLRAQEAASAGETAQPEAGDAETGLVETPEAKPKPKRKPRKPRAQQGGNAAAESDGSDGTGPEGKDGDTAKAAE